MRLAVSHRLTWRLRLMCVITSNRKIVKVWPKRTRVNHKFVEYFVVFRTFVEFIFLHSFLVSLWMRWRMSSSNCIWCWFDFIKFWYFVATYQFSSFVFYARTRLTNHFPIKKKKKRRNVQRNEILCGRIGFDDGHVYACDSCTQTLTQLRKHHDISECQQVDQLAIGLFFVDITRLYWTLHWWWRQQCDRCLSHSQWAIKFNL